jgi:hypothetical protein
MELVQERSWVMKADLTRFLLSHPDGNYINIIFVFQEYNLIDHTIFVYCLFLVDDDDASNEPN